MHDFYINMIEEIQQLVSKYTEHFKTKYYREKMEEITNNAPECVVCTLKPYKHSYRTKVATDR